MTSTRNGPATDPLRHFPTPGWAVDAVLPELPLCGTIVDAGCGEGAILARLMPAVAPGARLFGVELQEELAAKARVALLGEAIEGIRPTIVVADFLKWDPGLRVDLVIANPAFAIADEFYLRARELTKPWAGTVALLLRLDWLGTQQRGELLEADPPDANILERRPNFRRGADGKRGSDSCEYSWMIWGPGRGGRWKRLRCAPSKRAPRKQAFVATSPLLPGLRP